MHSRMPARHTVPIHTRTGWRAVLALLLLFALPLGQLHRSSTGACQWAAGSMEGVDGERIPATIGARASSPLNVGVHPVVGQAHDHAAQDAPVGAPAPGACGPALIEGPPRAAADVPLRTAAPLRSRDLPPALLAAPPPAPPPRLG